MNQCNFARSASLVAALAIWAGSSFSARATITFGLNSVITGDSPASSSSPWLQADFATQPGNQVKLILSAPHLVGGEDVGQWLFNIDPTVTQAQLNTLKIDSKRLIGGSFDVNGIKLIKESVNGVTRAGFSFDFDFGFPAGKAGNRFTDGDSVEIILGTTLPSSTLALTENSFSYLDKTGTYYSAAHIRNTSGPEGSGWIGSSTLTGGSPRTTVPELSTVLAGALLLLPFAASTVRILRRNRTC